MSRYYTGDIEGKFWFGVQPSDDADFFGGQQAEPNYIVYNFTADDLSAIEAGIEECIKALGENKAKLDAFFGEGGKGYGGYNDETVAEELGLPPSNEAWNVHVSDVLGWYARLELGEQIRASVKETGYCNFEAET
jgi:hypothetical protein